MQDDPHTVVRSYSHERAHAFPETLEEDEGLRPGFTSSRRENDLWWLKPRQE